MSRGESGRRSSEIMKRTSPLLTGVSQSASSVRDARHRSQPCQQHDGRTAACGRPCAVLCAALPITLATNRRASHARGLAEAARERARRRRRRRASRMLPLRRDDIRRVCMQEQDAPRPRHDPEFRKLRARSVAREPRWSVRRGHCTKRGAPHGHALFMGLSRSKRIAQARRWSSFALRRGRASIYTSGADDLCTRRVPKGRPAAGDDRCKPLCAQP